MATGAFENLYTLARQAGHEPSQKDARWVTLDSLSPNPHQPRRYFDPAALTELADNIRTYGILQPILCRSLPDGPPGRYQIVAGERRYQAALKAGLDKAPIIVRALDDRTVAEIGLAENLLRADLLPMEEAATMAHLIAEYGYTYEDLGAKLGKGKNYVWHRTNLLKLPAELQAALQATGPAAITTGHAEALAGIEAADWRQRLLDAVTGQELSVAETRRRARHLKALASSPLEPARQAAVALMIVSRGLSDEGFAQRLTTPLRPDRVPGPSVQVDLRELRSFSLFRQVRQQPVVDVAEAIDLLQRDLQALRRQLKESPCDPPVS